MQPVAPEVELYLPCRQEGHDDTPELAADVPAGQLIHAVEPVLETYRPELHEVQVVPVYPDDG